MPNTIVHVDMDAFFAAIEIRDNPNLLGKPVIIGGEIDSARGVVSTCSYEARRYGVHSAMPIVVARKLCPNGIYLRGNMEKYTSVSHELMLIFDEFSPVVEPLSIDEAFIDMTGCEHFYSSLTEIGEKIKYRIEQKLNLTCSIGIAENKFLAKLASEKDKPNGLTIVKNPIEFLNSIHLKKMWGVGKSTYERLISLGIEDIPSLRATPLETLVKSLGKQGYQLYQLSRGIDNRKVSPSTDNKSIGAEETYSTDIKGERIHKELLLLTDKTARRLRKHKQNCRKVTVKMRYPDFTTFEKSCTLADATSDTDKLFNAVLELSESYKGPFRLLGVYLSGLTSDSPKNLFDDNKKDSLWQTIDRLNEKGLEIKKATVLEKDK